MTLWEDFLAKLWGGRSPAPPAPAVPLPSIPASDAEVLQETATKLTVPAEGTVFHPYQDAGGVWTIGTGSTYDLNGNPVTADTPPISQAQALQLLERDLRSALQTVKSDSNVPLTTGEEEALTDFVYNVGAGNYAQSAVLQCLKAGDYDGACQHLADWDEAKGVVLQGLVKRRAAEQAVFKKVDTL